MQRTVIDWVEEAAKRYPNKKAIVCDEQYITYEELVIRTKRIATNIIKKGIEKKPIPILIDRNIDSIIAFFAVIYSGNYYVPIDSTLPYKRIETILNTLNQYKVIIKTTEKVPNELQDTFSISELDIGEIDFNKIATIQEKVIDTDPLYIIFTSGSTGVPKGVIVSHHSVIDLIDNFVYEFGFDEKNIFGNQAPFDFDVSVKDIYSTIKTAGTMVIIPKIMFITPKKIVDYLNTNHVNTIIWAVSALRIIENFKVFKNNKPHYLRNIMFSGEVMPVKVLNYWKEYIPEAVYVNLYGPTEITCNCTFYIVDKEYKDDESIPIGKAFKNTEIILLNENNEKCAMEEAGEICVRGSSLALGYFGNTIKTKEAFCINPLNENYEEKIYRTGDIGKYDKKGNLYFLARKDDQIKHMGHRIELGEIEGVVNAIENVDMACCIYHSKEEKIYLFYQSEKECTKEILNYLSTKLPKYMFPNVLIYVEKIPLSKHGKIDRVYLKEKYM